MSSREFDAFFATYRTQQWDRERLGLIRTALRDAAFTCDQASRMLKLFDWDADRHKACVMLYPRLVDRRNFSTLSATFDWSSAWRGVLRELGID